jgi:low temperature requirement protein LtrA
MLHDIQGAERVALARDICAYAHFPMIVGIVLFAFAMKTIVGHVDEQLDSVTAFALCGGCALYLLTYSAIRTRVERRVTVSRGRFVAALVLLLVLPLATVIPALAALALVTPSGWRCMHTSSCGGVRLARSRGRCLPRRGHRGLRVREIVEARVRRACVVMSA